MSKDELMRELREIDEILARRPALDSFPTRREKIEHAINTAKQVDSLNRQLDEIRQTMEGHPGADLGRIARDLRAIADAMGDRVDENECTIAKLQEQLRETEYERDAWRADRGMAYNRGIRARQYAMEKRIAKLEKQLDGARREVKRLEKSVCSTCNDTHIRESEDGRFFCTSCPTPCDSCRYGGIGAHCETTPCTCDCHKLGTVKIK